MGNTGTSVELLDTNGTQLCNLPSLPSTRRGHSQTVLTSCGGEDSEYASYTSCLTLNSGSWEDSHSLAQEREGHSAWSSPQGIMILGGEDSNSRTTTEILTENGDTTPGFNLDYRTM